MTITTSKQLAEALPRWRVFGEEQCFAQFAVPGGPCVEAYPDPNGFVAYRGMLLRGADPRTLVLALADRLEAEAKALRESVRKETP